MLALAQDARRHVIGEWQARTGQPPRALMVGPVPVVPWSREVIIDAGDDVSRSALYSVWPRRLELAEEVMPKNDRLAAGGGGARRARVAAFLVWARFPFWEVMPSPGRHRGDGARRAVPRSASPGRSWHRQTVPARSAGQHTD